MHVVRVRFVEKAVRSLLSFFICLLLQKSYLGDLLGPIEAWFEHLEVSQGPSSYRKFLILASVGVFELCVQKAFVPFFNKSFRSLEFVRSPNARQSQSDYL